MQFPAITAIDQLNPPRVRVRATVKLSATFFHDESSITKGGGGYESAIAPSIVANSNIGAFYLNSGGLHLNNKGL